MPGARVWRVPGTAGAGCRVPGCGGCRVRRVPGCGGCRVSGCSGCRVRRVPGVGVRWVPGVGVRRVPGCSARPCGPATGASAGALSSLAAPAPARWRQTSEALGSRGRQRRCGEHAAAGGAAGPGSTRSDGSGTSGSGPGAHSRRPGLSSRRWRLEETGRRGDGRGAPDVRPFRFTTFLVFFFNFLNRFLPLFPHSPPPLPSPAALLRPHQPQGPPLLAEPSPAHWS